MIDLAAAKQALHVDSETDDALIQSMLDQAKAIAGDYLGVDEVDELGGDIDLAVTLILGELFTNRGEPDPITPAVLSILDMHRDPATA